MMGIRERRPGHSLPWPNGFIENDWIFDPASTPQRVIIDE
jgi:hypothetical protein